MIKLKGPQRPPIPPPCTEAGLPNSLMFRALAYKVGYPGSRVS